MAAPAANLSYLAANPFKAIGGQTYAGGSSNATYALQHPEASKMAYWKARMMSQAGLGPTPPTQQELYSDTGHGAFGFDPPDPYAPVPIGTLPGALPNPRKPTGLNAYYASQAMPSQWQGLQMGHPRMAAQSTEDDWVKKDMAAQAAQGGTVQPDAFPDAPKLDMYGKPVAPLMSSFSALGAWDSAMAAGGYPIPGKTYLVGEEGPEAYLPESGGAGLVGVHGPEVRTFPQDGEILPHDKTMKMLGRPKPMAAGGEVEGQHPMPRMIGQFPLSHGRMLGQFQLVHPESYRYFPMQNLMSGNISEYLKR